MDVEDVACFNLQVYPLLISSSYLSLFPQSADRHGIQSISEARTRLTVIEHHTRRETLADSVLQLAQDAHTAGQRIGEGWYQQNIGGTSEQELSGGAPPIRHQLECSEDPRNPLNLVQDGHFGKVGDEARRVGRSCRKDYVVIETEVCIVPFPANDLCQSRLTALAWTVDKDSRCVSERLNQAGLSKSGIEMFVVHTG